MTPTNPTKESMARIIIQANTTGALRTLDERVLAEHLEDDHAVNQLLQRIHWALTDAEALEGIEARKR
jgi:hypothetical protein